MEHPSFEQIVHDALAVVNMSGADVVEAIGLDPAIMPADGTFTTALLQPESLSRLRAFFASHALHRQRETHTLAVAAEAILQIQLHEMGKER